MKQGRKLGCATVVIFIGMLIACLALTGCTTTKVVTVPEVHDQHHWHTDSVIQRDSVVKESFTTVMQLDSAEMAKYGIRLASAERAWLVKTKELERQIELLQSMSATKDSIHDSIPVPYPAEVVKEVEKPRSILERVVFCVGIISFMALFLFIVLKIKKYLP